MPHDEPKHRTYLFGSWREEPQPVTGPVFKWIAGDDSAMDAEVAAAKKKPWLPALAFNRGDRADTPIHVAFPLSEHLRLLKVRWSHKDCGSDPE